MNVGERIKKRREEEGFTQKELASKLGISFSLVSQYERGERNPKRETLERFAHALNTSTAYLSEGNAGYTRVEHGLSAVIFDDSDAAQKYDQMQKTTGNNIKILREEKGITRKDLAEKIGQLEDDIAKYEQGQATIHFKTLEDIAAALDVDLFYILSADAEWHKIIEGRPGADIAIISKAANDMLDMVVKMDCILEERSKDAIEDFYSCYINLQSQLNTLFSRLMKRFLENIV